MDIVLVPGMWLDGASWNEVTPALDTAGHRTHSLTLPGLESRDPDRSSVTYDDHIDAIVKAIDAASGPVLLVGHSAGCALVWAALDRRVDRVARAVLVAGFPSANGEAIIGGIEADATDVPLHDWSEFDDADLEGLDHELKARFAERAIPAPAAPLRGPQRLNDERRYDVPVTAVCTEYRPTDLQSWIDAGESAVAEFSKMHDLATIDLPTGHWPQFTRPGDLADVILSVASDRVAPDRVASDSVASDR